MPAQILPTISAAPLRSSPSTYSTRVDGLVSSLRALTAALNTRKSYVEGLSGTSTPLWSSGASYTALQAVYSGVNFKTYRAKTTHSGETTDPSLDATNWGLASGLVPADQDKLDFIDVTEAIDLDTAAAGLLLEANGAITAGDVLALNPDGTVKSVDTTGAAASLGTEETANTGTNQFNHTIYDPASGHHLCFFVDLAGTDTIQVVAGTMDATTKTMSWGAVLATLSDDAQYIDVATNGSGIFVLTYQDPLNSDKPTAAAFTYNGTTGSFGTSITLYTTTGPSAAGVCYDPDEDQFIACYGKGGAGASGGFVRAITYSGTVLTAQTEAQFESGQVSSTFEIVYDVTNDVAVILYPDGGNSGKSTGCVVSISGTTVTPNTPVVLDDTATSTTSQRAALLSGVLYLVYRDNSANILSLSATITATSLTSISTPRDTGLDGYIDRMELNSVGGDYLISYYRTGDFYPCINYFNISGSDFIEGTEILLKSEAGWYYITASFDTVEGAFCVTASKTNDNVLSFVAQPDATVTDAGDWLGIAEATVADGGDCPITLKGGINESQSGLTIGTIYYVDDDGSLTSSSAGGRKLGKATAADKILITEGNA